MKTRDSGMPDEGYWSTFFDAEAILTALGLHVAAGPVVDVGCGYGTFTLPVARLTGRRVMAIDIEPDLVRQLEVKARAAGLPVEGIVRDVAHDGTGIPAGTADVVLLFNLLHCEEPVALLREAHRVVAPGGRVGVIHWRSDVPTPRGPHPSIRPQPAMCRKWLLEAGFLVEREPMTLEPYHFGLVGRRGDLEPDPGR
jgi:SAM-dependent methyltransferase